MSCLKVCVVFFCCLSLADAAKPKALTFEQTAIGFVNALFGERDVKKAGEFFDKDAERKKDGKGSALKSVLETPLPTADQFALREIILFRKDDLAGLEERINPLLKGIAQTRWQRLGERIGDNPACMLVGNAKVGDRTPTVVVVFVFKEIDGQYKIVYQDGS